MAREWRSTGARRVPVPWGRLGTPHIGAGFDLTRQNVPLIQSVGDTDGVPARPCSGSDPGSDSGHSPAPRTDSPLHRVTTYRVCRVADSTKTKTETDEGIDKTETETDTIRRRRRKRRPDGGKTEETETRRWQDGRDGDKLVTRRRRRRRRKYQQDGNLDGYKTEKETETAIRR